MQKKQTNLYLLLFLLAAGHFCVDFMIGLWPVYKTMMHLDIVKAGLIAGLGAFIGEGSQIIFGPLGDRGYCKTLTAMGVIGAAACTCLCYTEEYLFMFALYLITCLGSGAFHPSAASFVNTLSTKQKNLFMTIFAVGGSLGLATSQLVFSNFHDAIGHTVLLAIPSLLLVCIMLKVIQNPVSTQTMPLENRLDAFKQFFQNKYLLLLYIACLCNQAIMWGIMFLLPDILKAKAYDPWIYLGGGHLCYILGAVCLMIPGGMLADKYSSRTVMIASIISGTVALYAILFISLPILILFTLLFIGGASFGLVNPISVAFGNQLMPNNPGVVNACLMGLVWFIAEGVGQFGGGLLTTFFVEDAPIKAIAIVGMLSVPSLLAMLQLPRGSESLEFA
jgi:FSR family fosmidomycin resistance protein-like MFS transporter